MVRPSRRKLPQRLLHARKGIAGKGMPQTCNYKISDKEFERELREYQASLAAEEAAKNDGSEGVNSADPAS